jgi:hypothetical protein
MDYALVQYLSVLKFADTQLTFDVSENSRFLTGPAAPFGMTKDFGGSGA